MSAEESAMAPWPGALEADLSSVRKRGWRGPQVQDVAGTGSVKQEGGLR